MRLCQAPWSEHVTNHQVSLAGSHYAGRPAPQHRACEKPAHSQIVFTNPHHQTNCPLAWVLAYVEHRSRVQTLSNNMLTRSGKCTQGKPTGDAGMTAQRQRGAAAVLSPLPLSEHMPRTNHAYVICSNPGCSKDRKLGCLTESQHRW